MTRSARLLRMAGMKKIFASGAIVMVLTFALVGAAFAQKDADNEPTSFMYFQVIKDDNGKPVRNAAVILHAVNAKGKQERGDMELKTDPEGKAEITIKLKRPQGQYSVYDDHPKPPSAPPKQDGPPPPDQTKKPN